MIKRRNTLIILIVCALVALLAVSCDMMVDSRRNRPTGTWVLNEGETSTTKLIITLDEVQIVTYHYRDKWKNLDYMNVRIPTSWTLNDDNSVDFTYTIGVAYPCEVRNHLVFSRVGYRHVNYNACEHRLTCNKIHVCSTCNPDKHYKKCRNCPACNKNCSDFVEVKCRKLFKPPYVCNGCYLRISGCTLEKRYYFPDHAQKEPRVHPHVHTERDGLRSVHAGRHQLNDGPHQFIQQGEYREQMSL